MNRRRGASLIELMVVISMLTVILGLVGVLFHRMFQAEQLSARSTVTEITTMRVADQFRRDIHAAESVKRSEATGTALPTLELKNSGDAPTILYTGGPNRIQRDVLEGQKTVAHETYRLPSCRITFPTSEPEVEESDHHAAFVTLYLERPHATVTVSTQAQPTLRGIVIDAELGRDQRLAAALSRPQRAEDKAP
ncbi:MAG TPA: prepilin-type N-terminal cleavage/methylation domain-containing protein [Schlesneria sp.]|jgi:type II secretory pathway pseudopilin PulG